MLPTSLHRLVNVGCALIALSIASVAPLALAMQRPAVADGWPALAICAALGALLGLVLGLVLRRWALRIVAVVERGPGTHLREIVGHRYGADRVAQLRPLHGTLAELLQADALRLAACARQGDLVARLGGVEIAEPFDNSGCRVSVGVSVGMAISPGDSEQDEELYKQADVALSSAKAAGRGGYPFHRDEASV